MINTIKKTAAVICAAVLVLTLCSCAKPDYTIGGATVKYNEGDYKTALEMFEVLAKEGDGVAAC